MDEVLAPRSQRIDRLGGTRGGRVRKQVESALPPPQSAVGDRCRNVSLFGMAPIAIFLHGTTLVARLKAADVPVRHRMGSAAAHTDAELAALLSGWPLRYV